LEEGWGGEGGGISGAPEPLKKKTITSPRRTTMLGRGAVAATAWGGCRRVAAAASMTGARAAPAIFFQAEDGIRDWSVTGVQTCALPIYSSCSRRLLPQSRCVPFFL